MWTVSIKAGKSELNDLRRNEGTNEQTMEQTKEGTNTSRDLLKFTNRYQYGNKLLTSILFGSVVFNIMILNDSVMFVFYRPRQ